MSNRRYGRRVTSTTYATPSSYTSGSSSTTPSSTASQYVRPAGMSSRYESSNVAPSTAFVSRYTTRPDYFSTTATGGGYSGYAESAVDRIMNSYDRPSGEPDLGSN